MAEEETFHEGQWLRSLIAESGVTQVDFARKHHIPRTTLTHWFSQKTLHARGSVLVNAVRALGFRGLSQFNAAIQSAKLTNRHVEKKQVNVSLPAGIEFVGQRGVKMAPYYSDGIGASPTMDRIPDEPDGMLPTDEGDIIVRVKGDCQSPKFNDGDRVVFSARAVRHDGGIIYGSSYYLLFQDGRVTFKRVFRDIKDSESLVLGCYNEREYPKEMKIKRHDIVKIMKAIRVLHDVVE